MGILGRLPTDLVLEIGFPWITIVSFTPSTTKKTKLFQLIQTTKKIYLVILQNQTQPWRAILSTQSSLISSRTRPVQGVRTQTAKWLPKLNCFTLTAAGGEKSPGWFWPTEASRLKISESRWKSGRKLSQVSRSLTEILCDCSKHLFQQQSAGSCRSWRGTTTSLCSPML